MSLRSMGACEIYFFAAAFSRAAAREDPLGLVFEQVAATGATDPVGFALVADLDRAAALGNDAERVRHVAGEGDPLGV